MLHYKYCLGIDMGIASIGTALLQLDEDGNPHKILDMGVRTFSVPEGAAERRTKRMERKHIQRRKQRLSKVRQVLQNHGLLSLDAAQLEQTALLDPYRLRAAAVAGQVTPLEDLGRCFLHMAKFRGAGFLTQQEESPSEEQLVGAEGETVTKDKQKTASSYRLLEALLNDTNQTLSQFFVARLDEKMPVRRRKYLVDSKQVEYAVPRFLVKDEFRRIWAMQRQFYPHLTEEIEQSVYKAIFADTPHAPYATGTCSLVPQEPRLPRMHRLAEKRRIYEQVNNIRYTTPQGECFLSRPVRDALVALALNEGQHLTKTRIRKEISALTNQKVVQVNLGDEASIKGFCHISAFAHVPVWQKMSEEEQDAVIDFIADPIIPQSARGELYPEDEFLEKLCAMLQLQGANAEFEASRTIALLAKDRSNLGKTATIKILEKLIAGHAVDVDGQDGKIHTVWRAHTHRTAADACEFVAEEERIRALQGSFSTLPYYGEILQADVAPIHPWHKERAVEEERKWGRIPNPVVHVALNQLRKVVNEVVALYGKPERIHVEFAREMGMSAVKREALVKEIQKREKENERINNALITLHLTPSRWNRIKYKLWEEQGKRSLYSLKEIEASDIASCEVDHLIPQAQGGTDSVMNLCLVFEDENKAKGNAFPYEAIQKIAPEKWQEISKIIHDKKFPKAKAWRFSSDAAERYGQEGDDAQTDSRLTDTSYMAKMGARYLRALCSSVVPVKGGTTSYLRHLWGLDGLEYELFGLPVTEHIMDAKTGEFAVDPATGHLARNPLWQSKPRIDHRHHAMDALVAACTSRHMVSRLVQEEKQNRRHTNFPVPFGDCASDFRYQVLVALRSVLPSPKQEHDTLAKLHDATKYRILRSKNPADSKDHFLLRYRKPFDLIQTKKDVKNIKIKNTIALDRDDVCSAHQYCQSIISIIESYYPTAEKALLLGYQSAVQSEGLAHGGKHVNEKAVVRKAIMLAQQERRLYGRYPSIVHKKGLVAVNKELQFGYEPKSNYCMDFYEMPNGKIGWECITRIDACDPNFMPRWKRDGAKRIWSLHNGDVLEVIPTQKLKQELAGLCASGKVYFIVQKMSEGRLQCNLLCDARAKTGAKCEEYTIWDSGGKGLSYYCELAARKIELSSFGKITRKHKRLWSAKKKIQKT